MPDKERTSVLLRTIADKKRLGELISNRQAANNDDDFYSCFSEAIKFLTPTQTITIWKLLNEELISSPVSTNQSFDWCGKLLNGLLLNSSFLNQTVSTDGTKQIAHLSIETGEQVLNRNLKQLSNLKFKDCDAVLLLLLELCHSWVGLHYLQLSFQTTYLEVICQKWSEKPKSKASKFGLRSIHTYCDDETWNDLNEIVAKSDNLAAKHQWVKLVCHKLVLELQMGIIKVDSEVAQKSVQYLRSVDLTWTASFNDDVVTLGKDNIGLANFKFIWSQVRNLECVWVLNMDVVTSFFTRWLDGCLGTPGDLNSLDYTDFNEIAVFHSAVISLILKRAIRELATKKRKRDEVSDSESLSKCSEIIDKLTSDDELWLTDANEESKWGLIKKSAKKFNLLLANHQPSPNCISHSFIETLKVLDNLPLEYLSTLEQMRVLLSLITGALTIPVVDFADEVILRVLIRSLDSVRSVWLADYVDIVPLIIFAAKSTSAIQVAKSAEIVSSWDKIFCQLLRLGLMNFSAIEKFSEFADYLASVLFDSKGVELEIVCRQTSYFLRPLQKIISRPFEGTVMDKVATQCWLQTTRMLHRALKSNTDLAPSIFMSTCTALLGTRLWHCMGPEWIKLFRKNAKTLSDSTDKMAVLVYQSALLRNLQALTNFNGDGGASDLIDLVKFHWGFVLRQLVDGDTVNFEFVQRLGVYAQELVRHCTTDEYRVIVGNMNGHTMDSTSSFAKLQTVFYMWVSLSPSWIDSEKKIVYQDESRAMIGTLMALSNRDSNLESKDFLDLVLVVFQYHKHAACDKEMLGHGNMDVILQCMLTLPFERLPVEDRPGLMMHAFDVLLAICKQQTKTVADMYSSFYATLKRIFKAFLDYYQLDASLDVQGEKKLVAENCDLLEKILTALSKVKGLSRMVPYLMADIIILTNKFALPTNIKKSVSTGMNALISASDPHVLKSIYVNLPVAVKDIYKVIMEDYEKVYKYTGKI